MGLVSERIPPSNPEAEEALLGAILLAKHLPVEIAARVEEADFWRPAHRTVWRAIIALADARDLITPVTLLGRLRATGQLEGIGGAPFIHTLFEAAGTTAEAERYAEIVAEASKVRRLIDAGTRIVQLGYKSRDASSVIAEATQLLERFGVGGRAKGDDWQSRLIPGGSFILDAPKVAPSVWGIGEQVAWAEGEPFLIVGPTGVGKTTLAGQLVRARLGIGDPVLGLPVATTGRRVLYLACDRPAQVQRSLARMVSDANRALLDERLIIWKGPPPADLAKHPDMLTRMCAEADADTVVIDSLKDVALELSKDDTGAGLNSALQRAIADGVEVLGLHHQRKTGAGGGKPNKLEDVYGSTWITAGCGSVILLWGEAGDLVVDLEHLKQPAETLGPFKVLHDHEQGTSSILEQVDVLKLVRDQPGITAADVALCLCGGEQPSANDRERARRKLERLVRDGLVHYKPGSQGGKGGGEPSRYYPITRLESDHGSDHAP